MILADEDIQSIRKYASLESGRQFLEERFGAPRISAVQDVLLQKAASADRELLTFAAFVRPSDPSAAYVELGGTYGRRSTEKVAEVEHVFRRQVFIKTLENCSNFGKLEG